MKTVIVKKVLALSLVSCMTMSGLNADPTDLIKKLGVLQGQLKQLSGILGTLKETAAEPAPDTGAWSKKIDFFRIPNTLQDGSPNPNNFENFYQAFVHKYLEDVLATNKLFDRDGKDWDEFFKLKYGIEIPGRYPGTIFDNIKNYIGRAWFEKYILDYCRKYIIEKYDKDRKQSAQNDLWVYEGKMVGTDESNPKKLRDTIQNVIAASRDKKIAVDSDIDALLTRAAVQIAQSVKDLFYHRERDPNAYHIDPAINETPVPSDVSRNVVFCDCLLYPLKDGYDPRGQLLKDERIDSKNVLAQPISYLIFETMHITLFHGVYFTNRLIKLFDFKKDIKAEVAVKDKEEFRIGFDRIFGDVMDKILGSVVVTEDGKIVAADLVIEPKEGKTADQEKNDIASVDEKPPVGLIMRQQKNSVGQPVLLVDRWPRMVIFGKQRDDDPKNNIYWSQTGMKEVSPDGQSHPMFNRRLAQNMAFFSKLLGFPVSDVGQLEDPVNKLILLLKLAQLMSTQNSENKEEAKKAKEDYDNFTKMAEEAKDPKIISQASYAGVDPETKLPLVTDNELRYAVWLHVKRHQCYSVGLLPYDMVQAFRLPPEKEAEVLDIIADAIDNKTEKGRLKAKAAGLNRVPRIVAFLTPALKKLNLKHKVGLGKEVFDVINAMEKHLTPLQLISVTEDEWNRVFAKLAEDSDYATKIKPLFENEQVRKYLQENRKDIASKILTAFDAVKKS